MYMIMFNDSYKICLDFHETFTNFSFDKHYVIYISILQLLHMQFFIYDEMDKRNDFFR